MALEECLASIGRDYKSLLDIAESLDMKYCRARELIYQDPEARQEEKETASELVGRSSALALLATALAKEYVERTEMVQTTILADLFSRR